MREIIIQTGNFFAGLSTTWLIVLIVAVNIVKYVTMNMQEYHINKTCGNSARSVSRITALIAFICVGVYTWSVFYDRAIGPGWTFLFYIALALLAVSIIAAVKSGPAIYAVLSILLFLCGGVSGCYIGVISERILFFIAFAGAIAVNAGVFTFAHNTALSYEEIRDNYIMKHLTGISREFYGLRDKTVNKLNDREKLVCAVCSEYIGEVAKETLSAKHVVDAGKMLWCMFKKGKATPSSETYLAEKAWSEYYESAPQNKRTLIYMIDFYVRYEEKYDQPAVWLLSNTLKKPSRNKYDDAYINDLNGHNRRYERICTTLSDLRDFIYLAMDLRYCSSFDAKKYFFNSVSRETRYVFLYVLLPRLVSDTVDYKNASAVADTILRADRYFCDPSCDDATIRKRLDMLFDISDSVLEDSIPFYMDFANEIASWDEYRHYFMETMKILDQR